MLNKTEMTQLLEEAAEGLFEIYGDSIKGIILFGSYARGDFDKDSDIMPECLPESKPLKA